MKFISILFLIFQGLLFSSLEGQEARPRARDLGLKIGVLETGPFNAITDVAGVRVGHQTVVKGTEIRTGVTAILPHEGNIFQEKVPAAICVANGFGKLTGSTQVEELGYLETPVILTNTLSVPVACQAVIDYILALPGNEQVESVNPVVGETNDGWLNDIRARVISQEDVLSAIDRAVGGQVEEGSVGAGTGTMCFDFKGGIGTASRKLSPQRGGYTVGILVQTNFGGRLEINGITIDKILNKKIRGSDKPGYGQADGSCLIVVATDAPLDSRNLRRLASRALAGIARTGGYYANGSGDYAVAFSTASQVRYRPNEPGLTIELEVLRNEAMTALFQAAVEASEEAILNSLFKATPIKGRKGHTGQALPVEQLRAYLEKIKHE
ncbi:MAG: P1 family peptidase [Acidobacteriota bacterium]|nr:P1 family peptidase [Acidobacteriota bacterium]